MVKIVTSPGNSGISDADGGGLLTSNHRGTGRGKTAGDLGERVPRVPLGIPTFTLINSTNPRTTKIF